LGVEQDALDDLGQFLARLGQAEQALAAADEDLDAELVLKVLDVLADAGLRGIERAGDFGQVEILAHGFAHDAELLKIHGLSFYAAKRSFWNTRMARGRSETWSPSRRPEALSASRSTETSTSSPSGRLSSTWASGPMAITRRILAGRPPSGVLAGSRSNSWGRTKPTACALGSWPLPSCSACSPTCRWPSSTRPWNRLTEPRKLATNGVAGWSYIWSGAPICSTLPLFISTTRSDTSSASSWSWVTKTLVTWISSCSCRSQRRSSFRTLASSAPNGSSSSSTLGSTARARANAMRWR